MLVISTNFRAIVRIICILGSLGLRFRLTPGAAPVSRRRGPLATLYAGRPSRTTGHAAILTAGVYVYGLGFIGFGVYRV